MIFTSNQTLTQALRWANDVYARADRSHWPTPGELRSSLDDTRPDKGCPKDILIETSFIIIATASKVQPERSRRALSMIGELRKGEPAHNQRSIAEALGVSLGTANALLKTGFDQLRADTLLMQVLVELDGLNKSLHPKRMARTAHDAAGRQTPHRRN